MRPDPANPQLRIAGANAIRDSYEAPLTESGEPIDSATAHAARHMRGDTTACMPILSRDEVRSLLARDVTSGSCCRAVSEPPRSPARERRNPLSGAGVRRKRRA